MPVTLQGLGKGSLAEAAGGNQPSWLQPWLAMTLHYHISRRKGPPRRACQDSRFGMHTVYLGPFGSHIS